MTNTISNRVEVAVTKIESASDVAEKFADASRTVEFDTPQGPVKPIGQLQQEMEQSLLTMQTHAQAELARIVTFTEETFSPGFTFNEKKIFFVFNGIAYTPIEVPYIAGVDIQSDISEGVLTVLQGLTVNDLGREPHQIPRGSDLRYLVPDIDIDIAQAGVTRKLSEKLQDVLDAKDLGAKGDGVANDTAQLATLQTRRSRISGQWRDFLVSDLGSLPFINEAFLKLGDIRHLPNITPEYYGNPYAYHHYGGQLKGLVSKITNSLYQNVGITFIGDSITWGVGASGTAETQPRDQTLSDPRDFYATNSYVNLIKRYVKKMLGHGVIETISNHPHSILGESIVEFRKTIDISPSDGRFAVELLGTSSDEEAFADAAVGNYRRSLSVIPGDENKILLKFRYTGSEFDLVFGCIQNGAKYNVYVNGELQSGGPFSTRPGDDGLTAGFSRARTHRIASAIDALITIEVIHYDNLSGNSSLYLESIRVKKSVRIKNNGLSGTSSQTYLAYSMPESKSSGIDFLSTNEYPAFISTAYGEGATSFSQRSYSESITGVQSLYGYISNSGWEFNFKVDPSKDRLSIAYSSIPNTGGLEVYCDGVLTDTFSTSSKAIESSYGSRNVRTVTLPSGCEYVRIKTYYHSLDGSNTETNYIYLEGVANYDSAEDTYPVQNSFGDGVAVESSDDICFIQLGTNDRIITQNKFDSLSVMSSRIERIIDLLPDRAQPVLMCANNSGDFDSDVLHSDMSDVSVELNALAQRLEIDFIDNYSIFDGIPVQFYTDDSLHPNDLGHKLIAANIVAAIKTAK